LQIKLDICIASLIIQGNGIPTAADVGEIGGATMNRKVTIKITKEGELMHDPRRPLEITLSNGGQSQVIALSLREATELSDELDKLREGA